MVDETSNERRTAAAAALVQRLEPSIRDVRAAIGASVLSPCRSKRGAVVFRNGFLLSAGCNYKPSGFDCDGSESCKANCRAGAVHAEQSAILRAGVYVAGNAELLHVKTIDGKLVPSGGPSCAECSKLALAAGIVGVWLYHENGWHRYDATEFHRQSLAAAALRGGGSSPIGDRVERLRQAANRLRMNDQYQAPIVYEVAHICDSIADELAAGGGSSHAGETPDLRQAICALEQFCRDEAEQAERDKINAPATSYHTACARKRSYTTVADKLAAALSAK